MRRQLALFGLLLVAFGLGGGCCCFLPGWSMYGSLAPLATPELEVHATQELEKNSIPALAMAVVDGDRVTERFERRRRPDGGVAHVDSDYSTWRVGSVSKMFTDLAVMKLVEQHRLDLDAPVTNWLPDFAPKNPTTTPITLRQLMAHRSGLLREPPVGHYFDRTSPSIAATVASLNDTTLVYEPGTHTKYSNAGITVVGRVVEVVTGRPFVEAVRSDVLAPMGLSQSAFERPRPECAGVEPSKMWRYDDEPFDSPTFELGIAPAGSLYTTLDDLTLAVELFLGSTDADVARRGAALVVNRTSLEEMWRPQFEKPGATSGFGLGFHVDEFDGHRRVGHDGAIYGYSTVMELLPDEKIGVVVIAAMDCVHDSLEKLAEFALRTQLHERGLGPQPQWPSDTRALEPGVARALAGTWKAAGRSDATTEEHSFELFDRRDELWLARGAVRARLRVAETDALVADDRLAHGATLHVLRGDAGLALERDGVRYERAVVPRPPPPPPAMRGLIGEYGWDHDVLFVFEKAGELHALIEWFFDYRLTRESDDVWSFPSFGLYQDEKLTFTRDEHGDATRAVVGAVVFPRRVVGTPEGVTFQIAPTRPVDELRRAALAAQPPHEEGKKAPELVDLATLDPTLRFDVRYATTDNFMGTRFYDSARAFMQKPAAEALVRAQTELAKEGFGLLIHDAYRPWFVTKMFWDGTPSAHHEMVADPAKGSRHNRGCAVDLTLCDLATGQPVRTTSGYDEFSDRANPWYPGGASEQRWLRDRLRRAMESQHFTVYEHEWWHFDYDSWREYPILNLPFEEIPKR